MIGQIINNYVFIMDTYFDRPLKEGDIPNSVQTLTFGYLFNQSRNHGNH